MEDAGPMIALLAITDGRREHIGDTLASARANLRPLELISERYLYDDSGDPDHARWLRRLAPDFVVFQHPRGRQGFGGAIRYAWSVMCRGSIARYIFHLEDDFTFNQPVELDAMAAILDHYPHLAQLALRRQPWNAEERAAGGIVEQHPDDYQDVHDYAMDLSWLEHRRFFTTNPSLYRSSLMLRGWPDGDHSEGRFGIELLEDDPTIAFGFWGARTSGEWVRHNGHTRNGIGY